MKKEKICGIYKITSPSGRFYIGQSKDIKSRWRSYKKYNPNQKLLHRSFLKYGFENHKFEIIEECEVEDLNCRERYWQDFYDVLNGGLNCKLTNCGESKVLYSDELRMTISKQRIESGIAKGGNNGNAKKVINYNTKEVLSCGKDLAKKLNMNYLTLMCMLNGQNYNNTQWCFLEDYDSEIYKENLKPNSIDKGEMVICTTTLKTWRNITLCALDVGIKPMQLMRYLNPKNDRKNPTTFQHLNTYINNNPNFDCESIISNEALLSEIVRLNSNIVKPNNEIGVVYRQKTKSWMYITKINNSKFQIGGFCDKKEAIEIKKLVDLNVALYENSKQFRRLIKEIQKHANTKI